MLLDPSVYSSENERSFLFSVRVTMRKQFVVSSILALFAVALTYQVWPAVIWALLLIVPLILVGSYDMIQHKHALWRTFPVIGRGRWFMNLPDPFYASIFLTPRPPGCPLTVCSAR